MVEVINDPKQSKVVEDLNRSARIDRSRTRVKQSKSSSLLIPLYIFSLAIPVIFYAGPLRLSLYRLILIATFIPCSIAWFAGAVGKIRTPDILILLSIIWSVVALLVNHGLSFAIEPSGILLIETFGSYLLARWLIHDVKSFRMMMSSIVTMILLILPFTIIETLTGRQIISEVLGKFTTVFPDVIMRPRYGFERAQGPFEHPILFGVISSIGFSFSLYLGRRGARFGSRLRSIFVALAVATSVSAGAILTLVMQCYLLLWARFTLRLKNRWRILVGLFIFGYIFVDTFSNRTPFAVFITYFTFNLSTAYSRILIFRFGSEEVIRNPFFGIGLNDWIRPWWMTSSVDNFWLVIAMRYGLPALVLFVAAIFLIFVSMGKLKNLDENERSCREVLLITLAALFFGASTVHFWNASYSLFMFLLGSGMWILDKDKNRLDNLEGMRSTQSRNLKRNRIPNQLEMRK